MLTEMPPEIMQSITGMAGTNSVINLWLSGDVNMRQLLGSRQGVRIMRLCSLPATPTSRWPMMLRELRGLRELEINRGHHALFCPSLVYGELKTMVDLCVLRLQCTDADEILFGSRKKVGKERLKEIFPRLEELHIMDLKEPLNPSDLPKTLTNLQLHGNLPPEIELTLPENLETLKLPHPPERLQSWPSSLTSLSLATTSLPSDLPLRSNLTFLQCEVIQTELLDFGFVFPRNLTHLDLSAPIQARQFCLVHLTRLRSLNLRISKESIYARVRLQSPGNTVSAPFPASLTTLVFSWGLDGPALVLPPSLKHLEATWVLSEPPDIYTTNSNFELPIPENSVQWLENPEYWTLDLDRVADKGLPRNLVEWSAIGKPMQRRVKPFPLACTSLPSHTLAVLEAPSFLLDDAVGAMLPVCPHLKRVTLRLDCSLRLPAFIREATHLQSANLHFTSAPCPEKLHDLPRQLEDLCISVKPPHDPNSSAGWLPFHFLPTSLVSLKILAMGEIGLAEFEKVGLLTKLTFLHLAFGLDDSIQDNHVSILPRSLQYFHLFSPRHCLTGNALAWLPPNLISLHCETLANVQNSHMAHLPRSLRTFYFTPTSTINPACIPLLPPRVHLGGLFHSFYLLETHPLLQQLPDPRIREGSPMPFHADMQESKPQTLPSNCALS